MKPIEVIIETPKGSTEKYSFEPVKNLFKLKKILPAGMVFPYDFGFIPDTKGEDGDPLDVMVLSEYRSFPGCLVECRIIGAILAEQSSEKGMIRNDRFVAVCTLSNIYKHYESIEDFPKKTLEQLELFFTTYNKAEGKKFKIIKIVKAGTALKMLQRNINGK